MITPETPDRLNWTVSSMRKAYYAWWLGEELKRMRLEMLLRMAPERPDGADEPIVVEAKP